MSDWYYSQDDQQKGPVPLEELQRMSLFGLAVLNFLIILAGVLAFCVGVFFAYPIVVLAGLVSYRWMQHGPVVLQDRTV